MKSLMQLVLQEGAYLAPAALIVKAMSLNVSDIFHALSNTGYNFDKNERAEWHDVEFLGLNQHSQFVYAIHSKVDANGDMSLSSLHPDHQDGEKLSRVFVEIKDDKLFADF